MSDESRAAAKRLRPGDALEVERLSDLGTKMVDVLALLDEIHARGAHVVETTTGRRSDRNAVEMIRDNLPRLRKGTTRRKAMASGRKGGRPREDDKRMKQSQAEAIWYDMRIKSNPEALRKMTGWSPAAAYKYIGPSGREKRGRPKKVVPKPRRT